MAGVGSDTAGLVNTNGSETGLVGSSSAAEEQDDWEQMGRHRRSMLTRSVSGNRLGDTDAGPAGHWLHKLSVHPCPGWNSISLLLMLCSNHVVQMVCTSGKSENVEFTSGQR